MKKTYQANIKIQTWFRKSTNEWIGEIAFHTKFTDATSHFPSKTEEGARNAAFAAIGYELLEATWEEERLK